MHSDGTPSPPSSRILVSGSWAYDHLMEYDGLMKEAILPEMLDHLSVAFLVKKNSVHFGGCAGNIAYTLKLLAVDPLLVGLVGNDFEHYREWLKSNGINASTLTVLPDELTASAYIVTDRKQNQIVVFHAGAMVADADAVKLKDYVTEKSNLESRQNNQPGLSWAIISPDDPVRMTRLAKECKEHGVKYIFDPSQQISNIDVEAIRSAIQNANILIVNEYEADLLSKKFKITREELASMAEIFIETQGANGSTIVYKEAGTSKMIHVDAVKPFQILDPTGCGDAFRAGLLYGLHNNLGLERSCQIGSLCATYVIEHRGTQTHHFTFEEFGKRFEESFGLKLLEGLAIIGVAQNDPTHGPFDTADDFLNDLKK